MRRPRVSVCLPIHVVEFAEHVYAPPFIALVSHNAAQEKMKAENLSAAAILAFKNSYMALVRKISSLPNTRKTID